MRAVLYGSGSPASIAAFEALAPVATVAAVVMPAPRPVRGARSALRSFSSRQARRALGRAARERGVPILMARPGPDADLEGRLRSLQPDLLCVATFPYLLPASALAVPRLGTLGVHPSLLPRHRGPAPLFWTYFHDDAEAGVTVFWMDAGEDTGDIVLQEAIPLARGRPGADLYAEVARRGGSLLARAVAAVETGDAARVPQDPARATREPAPERGVWRIDFDTWGAERVWHFLRGVHGRGPLLADARGRLVPHGAARGFRLQAASGPPGRVERVSGGFWLHCRDGVVELQAVSLATRAWWAARRLAGAWRRPADPSPRRSATGERTETRSSA
jgi:methionyl-tRNA formyltransferase